MAVSQFTITLYQLNKDCMFAISLHVTPDKERLLRIVVGGFLRGIL